MSFLSAFWPDLAAATIAVAVGIPAGLWINRQAQQGAIDQRQSEIASAERLQIADERSQTRTVLEQLEPVIRGQAAWFPLVGAFGNLNESYTGPLAEIWVLLRGQIVARHLSDVRLLGDLATHFERCARLDELIRLRASLSMGGTPAQQEQTAQDQQAIKNVLHNMVHAEGADPTAFADRVANEIAALAG